MSFPWLHAHGPSCLRVTLFSFLCPFSCGPYLRPLNRSNFSLSFLPCPVMGSSFFKLPNQRLVWSILYSILINKMPCPNCNLILGCRTQHLNPPTQDKTQWLAAFFHIIEHCAFWYYVQVYTNIICMIESEALEDVCRVM